MKLEIIKPRRNSLIESFYYVSIISTAFLLRILNLGNQAMHHDESMHAYYSWQLSEGFGLIHNPMLHGPLQMELVSLIFNLLDDTDFTARIIYAIFGTILVGLPFLFRNKLGIWGSAFTSLFLCFSPSMLYFSRFARNDIIISVFTLGLIIAIWKFFDTQKEKYLLIISCLLALSFGTKESAFLITATLIIYCALNFLNEIIHKINILLKENKNLSLITIFSTFIISLKNEFSKGISHNTIRPYLSILILLITLTLPQWAAFSGILQNTFLLSWSNLILVSDKNIIGMPEGFGNIIAFSLIAIMILLSIFIGYKWNWKIWWKCALTFYTIWILIYTTGLTNFIGGIKSGLWQSLGYWIVQQGEGRGAQPEYYYLLLTVLYEYLPLFISVIAIIYHFKRPTKFSGFLVYWVLITFIIYTVASEKMPWLLVNIALPMIVFSGYFTGIIFEKILKYRFTNKSNIIIATIVVILFCLSVRTSLIATFVNSDIPKEMLVYTQTSPDLKKSLSIIDEIDSQNVGPEINISIDTTSGYTWPWAWYLRNRPNVSYGNYKEDIEYDSGKIFIIHSENSKPDRMIKNINVVTMQRIPHRWWFPEETYRALSLANLIQKNVDPKNWVYPIQYWFNRSNIGYKIGSEDFYIIYLEGFKEINLISDKIRQ